VFARLYALLTRHEGRAGVEPHRRELLAGLAGRVLEVGAGNGRNFAHYPRTVTEVVAVEPEPHLRRLALDAAAAAPVAVRVVEGAAEALPLADGSVDAAVASLVLCSVRDQERALLELRRVLRSGGELRFWEHVAAERELPRRAQRLLDHLWPHLAGGCHTGRDTVAAIEAAGFAVEHCRRFAFLPCPLAAAAAPHVLGRARAVVCHG
jgi:ubiquinone/menaquinone biosynthesis C-methylase UbiE